MTLSLLQQQWQGGAGCLPMCILFPGRRFQVNLNNSLVWDVGNGKGRQILFCTDVKGAHQNPQMSAI